MGNTVPQPHKFKYDFDEGFGEAYPFQEIDKLFYEQMMAEQKGYFAIKYTPQPIRSAVRKEAATSPEFLESLIAKFRKELKSWYKTYAFNMDVAIHRLEQEILNGGTLYVKIQTSSDDMTVYPDETLPGLLKDIFREAQKQVSKEEYYKALCEAVGVGASQRKFIIITKYKHITPEEANQTQFSSVVSSSFSTHYYHKVEANIAGLIPLEFINVWSHYYSGGWN